MSTLREISYHISKLLWITALILFLAAKAPSFFFINTQLHSYPCTSFSYSCATVSHQSTCKVKYLSLMATLRGQTCLWLTPVWSWSGAGGGGGGGGGGLQASEERRTILPVVTAVTGRPCGYSQDSGTEEDAAPLSPRSPVVPHALSQSQWEELCHLRRERPKKMVKLIFRSWILILSFGETLHPPSVQSQWEFIKHNVGSYQI